jgi:hypothetical protein
MARLERIDTTLDQLTGEIISQNKQVIELRKMEPEPNYIKLYIDDLARLVGLQEGHKSILPYIAASVDYEGFVSLSAGRKARIAASAGCSVKSINNAITEYVKRGILVRVGYGEYELDPHLFAKGEWRKIRERRLRFAMKVTYSETGGRSIETEVIQDLDDEV